MEIIPEPLAPIEARPVGACLHGGIDSSSITARAARRLAAAAGPDAAFRQHRMQESPEPLDVKLGGPIIRTCLLGNGLPQTDRLSMRQGIEARTPLVDHGLVETAIGLREARPNADLEAKIWLRKGCSGLLPD